MTTKADNFICIQGWMVTDLHLKGNELLIYAIIYGFSQTEGTRFTGSLKYLQEWTQSTKQGVIKALKSLTDRGLILREENNANGIKLVYYRSATREMPGSVPRQDEAPKQDAEDHGGQLSLPLVNSVYQEGGQLSLPPVNSVDQGGQLSLPNNILYNIDLSLEEKKIEKEKKTGDSPPEENSGLRKDQVAKYGVDFEMFWREYPSQKDKGGAFAKYKARRNDGFPADGLLSSAKDYAIECQRKHTPDSYILHAATFLGPSLRFMEYGVFKQDNQTQDKPTSQTGNPFEEYKRGRMLDG